MPQSGRPASVKDVAALAGVALGTVSNVLNRPDRVSAVTRARVETAMQDLGFVRNESARQLRAGTSRLLAYVVLDVRNPFFTDVAAGMEEVAEQSDLSLMLCNSGQQPARESAYLSLLRQQRVQGILVTPINAHAAELEQLRRGGTPLVFVDRRREDDAFCSVTVDDELGGRLAVEHLVDLGHQRVAYVGGPATLTQVRDRLLGARTAWVRAGRSADDLISITTDALDVRSGLEAGRRLAGIPKGRRPTAAFCANDLLALGLLQQVVGSGAQVPGDLAIVGYDDIDFAAAAAVPLTSVRQPRSELGRSAVQLVLEEAGNPQHEHRHVRFLPELVARESTL